MFVRSQGYIEIVNVTAFIYNQHRRGPHHLHAQWSMLGNCNSN